MNYSSEQEFMDEQASIDDAERQHYQDQKYAEHLEAINSMERTNKGAGFVRVPSPKHQMPNGINLHRLAKLLAYSDRYQINIQFCSDQIAVYIMKDMVELKDFGGDFDFAIEESIKYLDRINQVETK